MKERGITLVALVVTIVVLLILAGITLVYVFGDNSIFKLAQDAKDKTDQAKKDEQDYFNNIDNTINQYVNGNGGGNNPGGRVEVSTITEKVDKNTPAKDSLGNPITIPAGFKIVPNSGEKPADKTEEQWNAEKVVYSYLGDEAKTPTVQDGIVIQNEADGNQFVWVPVGDIKNKDGSTTTIKLGRYSNFTVTDGVLPTPAQEASKTNYDTPVAIGTYHFEVSNSFTGGTFGETTYNAASSYGNTKAVNLQEWIGTTLDNGGYYLARYEASHNETDNTKAASKAGKDVWSITNQANAATAARATYSTENYYSDLVNSYAWDTAIVFIEAYDRSDYASKNLSTAFTTTGTNPDKVCNIHDMSGNAQEWTTETSTRSIDKPKFLTFPCTLRGGYYIGDQNAKGECSQFRKPTGRDAASTIEFSYRLVLCVR